MKQKDLKSQQNNHLYEIQDDIFIDFVKQEREIKMDLSFDDFMKKVEEEKPIKKSTSTKKYFIWTASLAACMLVVFGSIYVFKTKNIAENTLLIENEIVQHNLEVKPEYKIETEFVKEDSLVDELAIDNVKPSIQNKIVQRNTSQIKPTKEVEEFSANDELVIVNGENIDDEQRAKEITLDALKLFVANLDRSNEAVDQFKK